MKNSVKSQLKEKLRVGELDGGEGGGGFKSQHREDDAKQHNRDVMLLVCTTFISWTIDTVQCNTYAYVYIMSDIFRSEVWKLDNPWILVCICKTEPLLQEAFSVTLGEIATRINQSEAERSAGCRLYSYQGTAYTLRILPGSVWGCTYCCYRG